jgi:hypothetical protein
VLSVTSGTSGQPWVFLACRDHITIKVPLAATSLSVFVQTRPRSKLSTRAVEEFLELVREDGTCHSDQPMSGDSSMERSDATSHAN